MGTRNLICVFYKGRFVIAQCTQFDGYPEGQGVETLKFLQDSANVERLKGGLQHIYKLSHEELQQMEEEIKNLDIEAQKGDLMTGVHFVSSAIYTLWPSLSRDTGAEILEIVAQATTENPVPIQLDLAFANHDLFCEWAYVADLDHGVYEVYGGAQLKDKAVNKRFNDVGNELDTVPAFVKSFSFNKLPATEIEFISALNKALDEDWVGRR